MISRVDCKCGHFQTIEHGAAYPVADRDWIEDGWEKVGGAWACYKCLGKPMPPNYLSAIRAGELEEFDAEPEGAREDALDYLERLEGRQGAEGGKE